MIFASPCVSIWPAANFSAAMASIFSRNSRNFPICVWDVEARVRTSRASVVTKQGTGFASSLIPNRTPRKASAYASSFDRSNAICYPARCPPAIMGHQRPSRQVQQNAGHPRGGSQAWNAMMRRFCLTARIRFSGKTASRRSHRETVIVRGALVQNRNRRVVLWRAPSV